jgi:hypothetical protein
MLKEVDDSKQRIRCLQNGLRVEQFQTLAD